MTEFDRQEARFTYRVAIALALIMGWFVACSADAAVSYQLAQTATGIRTTACPDGDCPIVGCTPPTGFTEAEVGDGDGEICEQSSTEFDFNILGSNNATDAHLAYKDAGASDAQIEANFTDTFAGSTENFAFVGVGLRESALQASWLAQCGSLQAGSTAIQCKYGTSSAYTTVNCSGSGTLRPEIAAVSYDLSLTTIKGHTSSDGTTWNECFSTTRTMSDVLGYMVGASRSATVTTQATIDGFALGSVIDTYTPPAGGAPTQTLVIDAQVGTQGVAFTSLDISGNFTGETPLTHPYTATLPGSSGLSFNGTTGVLSGTPNANDVPGFISAMCAVNASGSTCQNVVFTIAPTPGTGDTFTLPDVGDTTASTFNCAAAGGANGATWDSLTPSSVSTPGPGDTILITSGERGNVKFQNCSGNSSNPITIKKTASATRLVINASGADGLLFENFDHLVADFESNWTGHTTGCGWNASASEDPLTDCGLLVVGTPQHLVKLRGRRNHISISGIEGDGNWDGSGGGGADVGFSSNDQDYCLTEFPADFPNLAAYYDGIEYVEGIEYTDFYFHDIGKEALYFGTNVNYGTCPDVPGQSGVANVPRIKDAYAARGYIDGAGYDGGNLKSCIRGQCLVEEVYVKRIGLGIDASGANSVCFSFFEGAGTIRRSKCRLTSSPPGAAAGFSCSGNKAPAQWNTAYGGPLECIMENNDISDTDGNSIQVTRGAQMDASRSFLLRNNTLTDMGGSAINVTSRVMQDGGGGTARDNLATKAITLPAGGSNTNNLQCAAASCGFVDHAANDYRILTGSPARNNGLQCPSVDLIGTVRPLQGICDQGAYEFSP